MKHLICLLIVFALCDLTTEPIKASGQVGPVSRLTFQTVSDMRGWVSIPDNWRVADITVSGTLITYRFDPGSSATDDNDNTIQPTIISGSGRWLKFQQNTGGGTVTTYTAGTGIQITSGVISNTSPGQTVSITGAGGLTVTGTHPNFTITPKAPVISTTNRSIGTGGFTLSSIANYAIVTYSVTCTVTNPLLAGSSSSVVACEYSTNGGSSWNPVNSISNTSSVGITVTLQLTNGQRGLVGGVVPANTTHVRVTATNTGTASAAITSTQEAVF
jgi:hypothetical protein